MLNLNSALITRTIRLVGKTSGASDETIEWVTHYALGSQKTKHLPECLMDESRAMVKERLNDQFRFSLENEAGTWGDSLVARVGGLVWGPSYWWSNTGASVVGKFNFRVTFDNTNEKLRVFCEDTWDFNGTVEGIDYHLCASIPKALIPIISKILNLLNLPHEFDGDNLTIVGNKLAAFNDSHAFKTVWEHEYDYSEFDYYLHQFVSKGNGSYILLPKGVEPIIPENFNKFSIWTDEDDC